MGRSGRVVFVGLLLGLALSFGYVSFAQHWSDPGNVQLDACDLLSTHDERMYCVARYQASAAAVWTESSTPEFAEALPVLALVGVFSVGLALGSAAYSR